MTPASATPTVELLTRARGGDRDAFDGLYARLYTELRPVARRQLLSQRRRAGTLDTTALLHETYARMIDETLPADNRAHFLGIAARAMRRVIVDYVRARAAQKRGGSTPAVTLSTDGPGVTHDIETLVRIDQALSGLAAFNGRLERVAECRLFGGLTDEETASTLGISLRSVQRDWSRARAWLQQQLGD
jgi:RNA polymerase sigma factor (TIGR02999 family)